MPEEKMNARLRDATSYRCSAAGRYDGDVEGVRLSRCGGVET